MTSLTLRSRRLTLALACVSASLAARTALAAPGDATRLEYERSARAATCPDSDALKAAVVKRLGYDPFFPAARQTISVEITDEGDALHAQMRLVNEQGIIVGSRALTEPQANCVELVASLALAVSIALDPSAALGGDGAAPESPAAEPTKAEAPTSTEDEPPAAEKPPLRRTLPADEARAQVAARANSFPLTVRASGFAAWDIAPAPASGVRAGVGLRFTQLAVTLEASDQFAANRVLDTGSAEASLLAGSIAPCFVNDWLGACALFRVGSLRTVGRGIQNPLAQRTLYVATGARLEAAPAVTEWLRVLVDVDAEKSLEPVTLRLYGIEEWKTPFLGISASLGLELRFR